LARRFSLAGMGTGTAATASALLAILEDRTRPPQARVHAFVVALDRALVERWDDPVLQTALARAVVAVGPALLAATGAPTVAATLAAAEEFVRSPDEEKRRRYVERATASYPYGPGDGCLTLPGDECDSPGSGCRSGAGTLAQVATVLGAEVVADRLGADLIPWLRGRT
jgi:hypothetical protein